MAKAYIDYLYTAKAQDIAGKHYYRPRDEKVAAKYAMQFPPMNLFTIDEVFGGWKEAQNAHFASGGISIRCEDSGLVLPPVRLDNGKAGEHNHNHNHNHNRVSLSRAD